MITDDRRQVVIVGGGAAGFFAAITCAQKNPQLNVVILEAGANVLAKVAISGGGRCNVTHHCFDEKSLVEFYPRGGRELRGAFSRFQPSDTLEWFESRGVDLKVEADGRMFPQSDQSRSIVNCLLSEAKSAGVKVELHRKVVSIERLDLEGGGFEISLSKGDLINAQQVMIATGGARSGYALAESLGHKIEPLVPSLFTFKINDARLKDLGGVSFDEVQIKLRIKKPTLPTVTGPLLITHWGLSGPAILRLSAWAARALAKLDYKAVVRVNFVGGRSSDEIGVLLNGHGSTHPRKAVNYRPAELLPRRYWERILDVIKLDPKTTWERLSKKDRQKLVSQLCEAEFDMTGRAVNKDEFVTCGGVKLKEVDFKTMESRLHKGLFFAGEVLDVDGLTGGFNFQNAWTGGYLAGCAMAGSSQAKPPRR